MFDEFVWELWPEMATRGRLINLISVFCIFYQWHCINLPSGLRQNMICENPATVHGLLILTLVNEPYVVCGSDRAIESVCVRLLSVPEARLLQIEAAAAGNCRWTISTICKLVDTFHLLEGRQCFTFAYPVRTLKAARNRHNLAPQEGYHNLGLAGI